MKSCLRFEFENSDVAGRFIDGILALPNMKGVTITIPGIPEGEYISEYKNLFKPENCIHYQNPTPDKCNPCINKCYKETAPETTKPDIDGQKLKEAIALVRKATMDFGFIDSGFDGWEAYNQVLQALEKRAFELERLKRKD